MELNKWMSKAKEKLKKYKYAILVIAIGIALMVFPKIDYGVEKTNADEITNHSVELSDEERLKLILEQIRGAGKVSVLLTYANGEETIYQTNGDSSNSENGSTNRMDTVTVTDSQRNQTGLVRQIIPPKYLGAIVVCSGADDHSVKLSVVEAVSKATGLGANQITVLKMK